MAATLHQQLEFASPAAHTGDQGEHGGQQEVWRILVVDDEEDVHAVTRLVLGGVTFEGRTLELSQACSAAAAYEFIRLHPDTAVILLDVVMEDEASGLRLTHAIRHELNNWQVRIIIRTGQPGYAPEDQVVIDYEINDYLSKSELTHSRLYVAMITALRSYRDIVQAEAHRQERAVAEAMAEAQSRFLAQMGHELRTPLYGVLGMAELLLESSLEQTQREYVNTIIHSGESLLVLLNDLLDIAKIQDGALQLESVEVDVVDLVEVDVVDLVKEIGRLFSGRARQKGIGFEIDMEASVPRRCLSDPTRLRQILSNLIGNAIKFTQQGHVRIHAGFSSAPDSRHRGELSLDVEDTGVGIDPAFMHQLFEPFAQEDVSTARRFGGSGLGLAIVNELTEAMGGSIDVHSDPGQGSRFRVRLPVSIPSTPLASGPSVGQDAVVEEAPVPRADRRYRILLAEDNPVNQRVTRTVLDKLRADVVIAEDGRQAVDAVAVQQFDLILMDCQMPLMDGYTATQTIRRLASGRDVPIIAMTANDSEQDRQRCFDVGMDDFIPKPVRLKNLGQVIHKWLESGR